MIDSLAHYRQLLLSHGEADSLHEPCSLHCHTDSRQLIRGTVKGLHRHTEEVDAYNKLYRAQYLSTRYWSQIDPYKYLCGSQVCAIL